MKRRLLNTFKKKSDFKYQCVNCKVWICISQHRYKPGVKGQEFLLMNCGNEKSEETRGRQPLRWTLVILDFLY